MKSLISGHPDEGDLLRFADGEITGREAKRIRDHLASCWKCRTELDDIQSTIADCVRYRETVLRGGLPEPPAPWADLNLKMRQLDEERAAQSWFTRFRDMVQVNVRPRQVTTAVAMLVILMLVVDQLRNAPSVRAAELLEDATRAAESREPIARRIAVRTGDTSLTRVIGDAPAAPAAAPEDERALNSLQPLFEEANYSWSDPLSARSFAAWRATLAEKRDEVQTIKQRGDSALEHYQIRTTTNSSTLREATLRLTMEGLRPVAATLRFGEQRMVELQELEPVIEQPEPPVEIAAAADPAPIAAPAPAPAPPPPAEVVVPATASEELRVFEVLRRLDADLGEPVEVRRAEGQVLVTGVGVSPEVGEQIHAELRELPQVAVRFDDPAAAPVPMTAPSATPPRQAVKRADAQGGIEDEFGSPAAFQSFSDGMLAASDEMMARVHALRRLATRFSPSVEQDLDADEKRRLTRLRREHAVALAGLVATIEGECRPALLATLDGPAPEAAEPEPPSNWQAATEALFTEASGVERLLAGILGGASASVPPAQLPEATLTGLARLRARATDYVRDSME